MNQLVATPENLHPNRRKTNKVIRLISLHSDVEAGGVIDLAEDYDCVLAMWVSKPVAIADRASDAALGFCFSNA